MFLSLFLYFSILAAIAASTIVTRDRVKAEKNVARRSDYGASVNG